MVRVAMIFSVVSENELLRLVQKHQNHSCCIVIEPFFGIYNQKLNELMLLSS